jgi:hypothetical protein
METALIKTGAAIGNIGTLDLRGATEDTISRIKTIGNVGVILYSPGTASMIGKVTIGNIDNMVEIPDDVDIQIQSGPMTITRSTFSQKGAPQYLLILGPLTVDADVQTEDIEEGLGWAIVAGPVIYPEHLGGSFQGKLKKVMGPQFPYPSGHPTRFRIGNVTLDEAGLNALEDHTTLVVMGNIDIPSVLPDGLIERKIGTIALLGNLEYPEENGATLLSHMDSHFGMGNMTRIPAGHERIDRPLSLDPYRLAAEKGQRLFCKKRVVVTADVEPEMIESGLQSLVAQWHVICPGALRNALAPRCSALTTPVLYYDGALWLIDNAQTLHASRFDFLEGQATLVVTGSLDIDPEIEPDTLFNRLNRVHNLGLITCSSGQMGALQARLGADEGTLELRKEKTDEEDLEKEEQSGAIGNAGYLKL